MIAIFTTSSSLSTSLFPSPFVAILVPAAPLWEFAIFLVIPRSDFTVLFSLFGFGMSGPFSSSLRVPGTVVLCGIIHSFVVERAILFPVWQIVLALDVSNTTNPKCVEKLTLSTRLSNISSFLGGYCKGSNAPRGYYSDQSPTVEAQTRTLCRVSIKLDMRILSMVVEVPRAVYRYFTPP